VLAHRHDGPLGMRGLRGLVEERHGLNGPPPFFSRRGRNFVKPAWADFT
jgi:hypothetical protein